ncbi:hypothetical protein SRHO_G00034970 [Serrasalmus rhombeus]
MAVEDAAWRACLDAGVLGFGRPLTDVLGTTAARDPDNSTENKHGTPRKTQTRQTYWAGTVGSVMLSYARHICCSEGRRGQWPTDLTDSNPGRNARPENSNHNKASESSCGVPMLHLFFKTSRRDPSR